MATNPYPPPNQRTTPNEKRPHVVPGPGRPNRPGSGVPGVMLAIIVAAVLIGAILYYFPQAPKKTPPPTAAQAPVQPVSNELQFSNLQMTMAPTGGAMTLDGRVMNTGNRPIIGATALLSFRNPGGAVLESISEPLMGMAKKGQDLVRDDLANDPLKPNDARPFRVTVSRIPVGWNHAMPEMKVTTVAAEGNR